jgi:arylsulfatase A-like enzyme
MEKKPNIIYILADDLGYGDLGCYGQKKIQTPCIDKMAEEGMLFTHQYGGAPVCGPSRACLMTGMHQGSGYIKGNPVKGNDIPLRKQDVIIPEILKKKGYETACIGKWGLGNKGTSGYPTNKGFDYFFGYDSHKSCHNYYPPFLLENDKEYYLKEGTYSHNVLTNKALEWIKGRKSSPFFMYLAYTLPHSPYNPPNNQPYANENWTEQYKNYGAMVSMLDQDVGKILDYLKKENMDKDTLVIFASDNGPGSNYTKEAKEMVDFFNSAAHFRGMKRDVYEGGIRVPFIAWWPTTVTKGTSHLVTAFQDILPTICDIVEEEVPVNIDGISILPTLLNEGKQEKHHRLYWEFIYMGEPTGSRQSCYDLELGFKGVRFGSKGELELFYLNEDEKEQYNVASQYPDIVHQLEEYLNNVRTESYYWPLPEYGWMSNNIFL